MAALVLLASGGYYLTQGGKKATATSRSPGSGKPGFRAGVGTHACFCISVSSDPGGHARIGIGRYRRTSRIWDCSFGSRN